MRYSVIKRGFKRLIKDLRRLPKDYNKIDWTTYGVATVAKNTLEVFIEDLEKLLSKAIQRVRKGKTEPHIPPVVPSECKIDYLWGYINGIRDVKLFIREYLEYQEEKAEEEGLL